MDRENSTTTNDLTNINPLIDPDGDTYKVAAALTALSCLLETDGAPVADTNREYGLAILLRTCATALFHMSAAREVAQ